MLDKDDVLEMAHSSLNHVGEELCGDHVETRYSPEGKVTMVLADGLGSGVQASILSTLTSNMLSSLISGGVSLDEAVESIIKTLPLAKNRGNVAYSTFTILEVLPDFTFHLANYDNPTPVYISHGSVIPLGYNERTIFGKKIAIASGKLEENDTIIMMSDGVLHAGIGETLNFGWSEGEISSYMGALYDPSISSKNLATLLTDHCDTLYNGRPGDDTTSAVLRRRKRVHAHYMVGPATSKDDDKKMMDLFFSPADRYIVSGGSSSHVVANYLHKEIGTELDYVDPSIPPISYIEGVDLVTEGVITLNRLVNMAKDYLGPNKGYFDWSYKQDGVSLLSKMLFEEATDIDFYVGCAVNPAHQDPAYHIDITIKLKLVDELAKLFKTMGKRIAVHYF